MTVPTLPSRRPQTKKAEKPSIAIAAAQKQAGGQKGHGGTTLTKAEVEEKIHSGRCRHEIKTMGNPGTSPYVTKYVIDLDVETVVTEVRIYADEVERSISHPSTAVMFPMVRM